MNCLFCLWVNPGNKQQRWPADAHIVGVVNFAFNYFWIHYNFLDIKMRLQLAFLKHAGSLREKE